MRQSLFVLLIGIVLTGLAEARSLSDIEAVRTTIFAWAKARESRNIDNYMSFYSPAFKSGELDFQRWREKKTTLFQSPGHVSLKINDLWVFAGALLLSYYFRKFWPIFYFIAFWVGYSRIYLGAHFPFDVIAGGIAGTLLGFGFVWIGNQAIRFFEKRSRA